MQFRLLQVEELQEVNMNMTNATTANLLCGYDIPPPYVSESSVVRLTFMSDYSVTKRGFFIHYKLFYPEGIDYGEY